MIRAGWRIFALAGLPFLFFSTPVSGGEVEKAPVATEQPPTEVAPTPEEVAEILRQRELLELLELLQDLDVLTQSEEKR
jgi:hypothetical protein